MRLIKLTLANDKSTPSYFNIDVIESFRPVTSKYSSSQDAKTTIYTICPESAYDVKESIDEVIEAIRLIGENV